MLQFLVFILLMSISYVVLFKLLPIVGAIPFIIRHVKSEDITGFRLLILTILYVPLAIVVLQGVMHWRGYGLQELVSTTTLPNIFLGLAGGIVLAVLNLFTDLGLKALLREDFSSTLKQTGQSTAGLISMIVVSWLAGGVLEESFWRGFWFAEWQAALGSSFLSLTFCVIVSSILFGLGHRYQGWSGVVSSTVGALGLGLLYLWQGNLLIPVIAHGTMDAVLLPVIWHRFGNSG